MGGVIKKNEFVSITGSAPTNAMKAPEARVIDNGEKPIKQDDNQDNNEEVEAALSEQEIENQRVRDELNAELALLKKNCDKECDEKLVKAEKEAIEIVDEADSLAQNLRESVEDDCAKLRKKAEENGYKDGFAKGEQPGYDAGFAKGKEECTDTLRQLNAILARIPGQKEKIFKQYENQLFDLIFNISNKITAGSLNQKDKSVISQMLKESAKSFRGSKYIKVSLSKLDIEESVNVDLEDFRSIFRENQHIEFEILKDAPKGTLILDNGSEISDAGIQTQLKMIENLGKGKFRNNPELDEEEEGSD